MSKRSELKKIVDFYNHYYKLVFKLNDYRFRMSDNRQKLIFNFIDKIKSLTNSNMLHDEYLKTYLEFQFNHWYKHESESEIKRIQPEWIFGDKALKRWEKTDKKISAFVVRKNLKKDIKFKAEFKKENWNNIVLKLNDKEEQNKTKFFNTVKGFYFCLETTTLYNHKSKYCFDCKFNKDCKEKLKQTYPKIFKKRGY